MNLVLGDLYHLPIKEENKLKCFRCGSTNVGKRFGSESNGQKYDHSKNEYVPMDTEDYQVHYDTYCCFDCKAWDFYSAFDYLEEYVDLKCPYCEKDSRFSVTMWDDFSGYLELRCSQPECRTELTFRATEKDRMMEFKDIVTPLHRNFNKKIYDALQELNPNNNYHIVDLYNELFLKLRGFLNKNKQLINKIVFEGRETDNKKIDKMAEFVIRGKNGTIFTSTEIGTYGQEITYDTYEKAELALKEIRFTLPHEEFEIKEI
jgi:hypothetical protein